MSKDDMDLVGLLDDGPVTTIDVEIERLITESKTQSDEELEQLYGFNRTNYMSKLNPLPSSTRSTWQTIRALIRVLRNGPEHIERIFDDLLYLEPLDTFEMTLEYAVMFKVNIEMAPDNEDRSISIELYNRLFNDRRYG